MVLVGKTSLCYSTQQREQAEAEAEKHKCWCGAEQSAMVGWDLSLLTSLVPAQSGVCRLCLIKQLNMA